jgi:Na+(H+)/acetate symporter ActP
MVAEVEVVLLLVVVLVVVVAVVEVEVWVVVIAVVVLIVGLIEVVVLVLYPFHCQIVQTVTSVEQVHIKPRHPRGVGISYEEPRVVSYTDSLVVCVTKWNWSS